MKTVRILALSLLAITLTKGAFADLPPGWHETSITPGQSGSVSYDAGVWTIALPEGGARNPVAPRCVYTYLEGDGVITARIRTLDDNLTVLMGEDLNAAAGTQCSVDISVDGGVTARFKAGVSYLGSTVTNVGSPCWVWLERKGNRFTGYVARDGAAQQMIGSATISMGTRLHVGLAVYPKPRDPLFGGWWATSAVFDNVTVESLGGEGLWRVAGSNMYSSVSGNVGIGTQDPAYKLDVRGTAATDVLVIRGGADVAEPFSVSGRGQMPKGSLAVIDDKHPGRLKLSDRPYDRRVAGVVSGAGGLNPGLTLSPRGIIEDAVHVALTGRVYALADCSNGTIKPGDMLTTSSVPGHAMKATDRERSYGAVIGKAMSSLEADRGLVLVLVSLQ